MDISKLNLLGAYVALFILIACSLVFIFRIFGQEKAEYWTGIAFMLMLLPIVYLIFATKGFDRPTLYYIQLALMILFIFTELFLDYIFKIDFRQSKSSAIPYVMLFFASTGGMIGVASQAGKIWTIISVLLFVSMTILAFVQHSKTGM